MRKRSLRLHGGQLSFLNNAGASDFIYLLPILLLNGRGGRANQPYLHIIDDSLEEPTEGSAFLIHARLHLCTSKAAERGKKAPKRIQFTSERLRSFSTRSDG